MAADFFTIEVWTAKGLQRFIVLFFIELSTRRVESSIKNRTINRCSPLAVQTSIVKKSAATINSQCCVRNSFQVVLRLRSGAGSMPLRFRMLATVPRARLCPRFDSAPMIRVYPQSRFSVAIWITRDSISLIRPWSAGPAAGGSIVLAGDQLPVPGQESLRRDDRCHRRQSAVAESLCFDSQSTALFVRKPESTTAELLTQDLVLLAQILDCLLLLLIHPARDRDQHEPERIENAHPSTVSRVISATTRHSHCFQRVRVSGHNELLCSFGSADAGLIQSRPSSPGQNRRPGGPMSRLRNPSNGRMKSPLRVPPHLNPLMICSWMSLHASSRTAACPGEMRMRGRARVSLRCLRLCPTATRRNPGAFRSHVERLISFLKPLIYSMRPERMRVIAAVLALVEKGSVPSGEWLNLTKTPNNCWKQVGAALQPWEPEHIQALRASRSPELGGLVGATLAVAVINEYGCFNHETSEDS